MSDTQPSGSPQAGVITSRVDDLNVADTVIDELMSLGMANGLLRMVFGAARFDLGREEMVMKVSARFVMTPGVARTIIDNLQALLQQLEAAPVADPAEAKPSLSTVGRIQ